MSENNTCQKIFIISPVFDEEEAVGPFIEAVIEIHQKYLTGNNFFTQLVIVDDGSGDKSYSRICMRAESKKKDLPANFLLTGLSLSRNFGQQAALQAGLEYAFEKAPENAFFILMDSDLQHPPQKIPEIVDNLSNGYDHVQVVREETPGSVSLFKGISSHFFYLIFRYLANIDIRGGSSDFRGASYPFIKAYLRLKERGRFNRGLFYWIGFNRKDIYYRPQCRIYGRTKYSARKMSRLAMEAIFQFSSKPLIIGITFIVALSFIFCSIYFGYELYRYFQGHTFVLGWASIIFIITFWGGAISLGQLLLAIYISRIFTEIKRRPIYVINKEITSNMKK